MSQSNPQNLETGNDTSSFHTVRRLSQSAIASLDSRIWMVNGHSDRSQPIQLPQSPPLPPYQGEINHCDRSWSLYAMYSKVTREEDNKMAERFQKAADGLLVFSGLFSATVAALLAVTIPDLKPNSQDTSAFYLENIYQLFSSQNTSNGSTPSILAKAPAFSPPKYVVWVNSLWSLALLISLTGAMLVTLEQRAALQYVMRTQNKGYSPETRARFHARVVDVYGPLTFNLDSSYLFCLHLSLFLFAAGLLIYFFNVNRATFCAVVLLIGITTFLYTSVSLSAIWARDILYVTPFSIMVLRAYLGVLLAMVQVFSWIKPLHGLSIRTKNHHRDLSDRYRVGVVEGNAKLLEEAASKPSWKIDAEVLERMLIGVDEDHELERLFDAIPGFCDSDLVQKPLHPRVKTKLRQLLDGFLDRTFSSHLVPESVRNDRLIICLDAAYSALGPSGVSLILDNFFCGRDEMLKSVEVGHSLVRWNHCGDALIDPAVRRIVACIIAGAQDRNDRWAMLVKEVFGVPDRVIRDHLVHGDNMLLAILLHVAREALDTGHLERGVLWSLSQFDIRNTSAELQHDFCALWNQIVQEARNEGIGSTSTQILVRIRHLFTTLHQGTNVVPNQLSAPLDSFIIHRPSSYPSCNIPFHHPDSATQGLAITPQAPTVPPPQLRSRRLSEPAIGVSVAQRFQSSLPRLRRTQSCRNFPTVPLPTQPGYPPKSSPTPVLVSPPPPLTDSPVAVTEDVKPDFAVVSVITGTPDPIHGSTSGSGPTVQQVEETSMDPPSVALGSLPTPLPTPALSHSTISAMLPSSIDPATTQTHFLHHPPGAPTLTTMPLSSSQQVTTVSDQRPSSGRARGKDDIQNSRPPTPRTDYHQPPPGGDAIL